MIVFEWKEFPRGSQGPREAPRARLLRGGDMSLNHAAYALLGEPKAVVLLFDPGRRAVGLRPAPPNSPHAYPVRKQRDARSYLISTAGFCKANAIPTGQLLTFADPYLVDGLLVLELDKGIATPAPTRHGVEDSGA